MHGAGLRSELDVVVLRASGANGYNEPIFAMNGVDSVETLVVTSAADANRPDVVETVWRAEVIFFAGGDPCDYVRYFKGTRLKAAVDAVEARGGGIGGTSAGLAIQGDYVYDACAGSADSRSALGNPYASVVRFTYDFFAWKPLGRVITAGHFVARDRMGRLMAFVARQIRDSVASDVLGIGLEEATSLVVDTATATRG
jgi:cyanophycinase-like exopeptidase